VCGARSRRAIDARSVRVTGAVGSASAPALAGRKKTGGGWGMELRVVSPGNERRLQRIAFISTSPASNPFEPFRFSGTFPGQQFRILRTARGRVYPSYQRVRLLPPRPTDHLPPPPTRASHEGVPSSVRPDIPAGTVGRWSADQEPAGVRIISFSRSSAADRAMPA
jgi:hypothetical protein